MRRRYPIVRKSRPQKIGGRYWIDIHIETRTHIADTSVPVYTHSEFLLNRAEWHTVLGIHIKPHVRVKAGELR